MLTLLKKDFITSKKMLIFLNLISAVILGFITIKANISEVSSIFYAIATMIIPFVANKAGAAEELKKHYDSLINSFPIKRKDVVISKYLYYLLLYVVSTVFLGAVVFILGKYDMEKISFAILIQSMVFIYFVLLTGVTNYIYYRFDYNVATKYGPIIIIVIIYLPILIYKLLSIIKPDFIDTVLVSMLGENFVQYKLPIIIFAVGLVIYFILMFFSIKRYKQKDLD